MQINDFNWKIGGPAGFGIMSSGEMLSKTVTRGGLFMYDYIEKPSLIRGGHNTYQVYISADPVRSQRKVVNLLVALNADTVTAHKDELIKGSAVMIDSAKMEVDSLKLERRGILVYDIPFNQIVRDIGGDEVMRNTVTLGATMALIKFDFERFARVIKEQFKRKEQEVIEQNIKAARAGYDYVSEHFDIDAFKFELHAREAEPRMLVTANDAVSLGALSAGCKFFAAYPMTPASSILHTLAKVGPQYGMVVRHAEDEISVINMVQGAASTGARVMLATSGGGFALMIEGLSLAGITETPLVAVEVMRPGPATGLPTWTEQGDLKFVISAGHGEFPKIVLAPGDAEEAFYLTKLAFNLADKIQSPVIILSDKYIGEDHISLPYFKPGKIAVDRGKLLTNAEAEEFGDGYRRYEITKDGISPRAVFGQPGPTIFINSDEHDEFGFSEESAANRIAQVEKRHRKLDGARKSLPQATLYGSKKAQVTLVGWGSVKGPVLDALDSPALKKKVNFLHFSCVEPLPLNAEKMLREAKQLVLVENNSLGQFADIIAAKTGIMIQKKILRFDGCPFYQSELVNMCNKL